MAVRGGGGHVLLTTGLMSGVFATSKIKTKKKNHVYIIIISIVAFTASSSHQSNIY